MPSLAATSSSSATPSAPANGQSPSSKPSATTSPSSRPPRNTRGFSFQRGHFQAGGRTPAIQGLSPHSCTARPRHLWCRRVGPDQASASPWLRLGLGRGHASGVGGKPVEHLGDRLGLFTLKPTTSLPPTSRI